MYEMTTEQITQIKATVGNGLEAQEAVFNALDFNPYEDEGAGGYDSVVWSVSAMKASVKSASVIH